jgi:hypothetical protein
MNELSHHFGEEGLRCGEHVGRRIFMRSRNNHSSRNDRC